MKKISIIIITGAILCLPYSLFAWWNASWTRRRPLIIDNTQNTNTLTDYQVKVNVSYDADMQTNFQDIRFIDSDDATELNYWIETYTASSSATVWVKIPSITASSEKKIYMYYGNGTVASNSNGFNTFIFFDDFEDGDISDWTTVETPEVVTSQYVSSPYSVYLNCEATDEERIWHSIPVQTGEFVAEFDARYTSTGNGYFYLPLHGSGTIGPHLAYHMDYLRYYEGTSYHNVYDTSADTWHILK